MARDAATKAIEFALKTDEGIEFLRCWMHGDFNAIRKEWPDAPESVFIGADPLMAPNAPPVCNSGVESVIDAVMAEHPKISPAAQARYYEEVHQHLAPLARELERENKRLRDALKKANEQAEHFEREWYLRGDALERVADVARNAREGGNDAPGQNNRAASRRPPCA